MCVVRELSLGCVLCLLAVLAPLSWSYVRMRTQGQRCRMLTSASLEAASGGGGELIVVTQRIPDPVRPHWTAHSTRTLTRGRARSAPSPSYNVERLKQVCDNVVERTPLPLQLVLGEAVPPQHLFGRHPVLTDARVAVLEALQPSLAQTVVDLS